MIEARLADSTASCTALPSARLSKATCHSRTLLPRRSQRSTVLPPALPPQPTPGGALATSLVHSINLPYALAGISKYTLSSIRCTVKTPLLVLAFAVITSSYFLSSPALAPLGLKSFFPLSVFSVVLGSSGLSSTARAAFPARNRKASALTKRAWRRVHRCDMIPPRFSRGSQ